MLKFNRITRLYSKALNQLRLTLSIPTETIYSNYKIRQINFPTANGPITISNNSVGELRNIQQITPGLIQIESKDLEAKEAKEQAKVQTKEQIRNEIFFTSGGFVAVDNDNLVNINAVSVYPLTAFKIAQVKEMLDGTDDEFEKSVLSTLLKTLENHTKSTN